MFSSTTFATLLAVASFASANPLAERASTNRCNTGDSCFPKAAALSAFNSTIGGKLTAERPVESACYASDPNFNAAVSNSLSPLQVPVANVPFSLSLSLEQTCASYTAQMKMDSYLSSNFATYEQTNCEFTKSD